LNRSVRLPLHNDRSSRDLVGVAALFAAAEAADRQRPVLARDCEFAARPGSSPSAWSQGCQRQLSASSANG